MWAIIVAGIALATAIGGFMVVRYEDHQPQPCAGIGLTHTPVESTPQHAFDTYVTSRGGDPKDRRLAAKSARFATFNATIPNKPAFATITLGKQAHGWSAQGACV